MVVKVVLDVVDVVFVVFVVVVLDEGTEWGSCDVLNAGIF